MVVVAARTEIKTLEEITDFVCVELAHVHGEGFGEIPQSVLQVVEVELGSSLGTFLLHEFRHRLRYGFSRNALLEVILEKSGCLKQGAVPKNLPRFGVFNGGGIQRHVEGTNGVDCAPVDEPVLLRQLQGSGVAAVGQIRLEPRFGLGLLQAGEG